MQEAWSLNYDGSTGVAKCLWDSGSNFIFLKKSLMYLTVVRKKKKTSINQKQFLKIEVKLIYNVGFVFGV